MPQSLVQSRFLGGSVAGGSLGFECTMRPGGRDVAWIRARGELDIVNAPRLRAVLSSPQPQLRRLVLDLRQVTFIDGCGLHVVVAAGAELRREGRRLVLVRGPADVDRLFNLTRASETLEIVDLSPEEPPVLALLKLTQREHAA